MNWYILHSPPIVYAAAKVRSAELTTPPALAATSMHVAACTATTAKPTGIVRQSWPHSAATSG